MSTSIQWLLATFITTRLWNVLVYSRILIKFISHSKCIRNLASLWLISYFNTTFSLGTKQGVAYQMKRYKRIRLNHILLRSEQLDLTYISSLNSCLFSVFLYCSSKLYYVWHPELIIFVQSNPLARNALCHQGSFLSFFVTQLKSRCLWKFWLFLSLRFPCLALGIQSQVT